MSYNAGVVIDDVSFEYLSCRFGGRQKVTIYIAQCHVIRVSCEHISLTQQLSENYIQLECGPMTNVMVALPNIGGAIFSTPQSLADAHY